MEMDLLEQWFMEAFREEKITLNYDTFWSGTGHREEKEVSTDTLEYARKLLFEEKFWKLSST